VRRGIGYCENAGCENSDRIILPEGIEAFACESCGQPGKIEMEGGFLTGDTGIIREVRVDYHFDPKKRCYRATAIVRDETLPAGLDVYTRRSPFTKSEVSALSLAEALFIQLNRCRGPTDEGEIPRSSEFILFFDDDIALFRQSLRHLTAQREAAELLERRR
jgi:hypothetical protein